LHYDACGGSAVGNARYLALWQERFAAIRHVGEFPDVVLAYLANM
jgi:hypothetical protein